MKRLNYGPAAVGTVVSGLIIWGVVWVASRASGHWWFWPIAVAGGLLSFVLVASVIGALLPKRPAPTLRCTGVRPEDWVKGPGRTSG